MVSKFLFRAGSRPFQPLGRSSQQQWSRIERALTNRFSLINGFSWFDADLQIILMCRLKLSLPSI